MAKFNRAIRQALLLGTLILLSRVAAFVVLAAPPPRSTVQVSRLPKDACVEIEVIATIQ